MLGLLLVMAATFSAPVEMELLLADFEKPPLPTLAGQNLPAGSSVERSAERAHGGEWSAKLHYRYPGVKGISYAAVALRGEPVELVGQPRLFRVWVCGDGVGQSFHLRLRDATGQTHQYKLGTIDFTGWQQMSCSLGSRHAHWGGANDGRLHLPLVFDCLIVDSDIEPSESDVYLDDLSYVTVAEPLLALVARVETGWFGNVVLSPGPWRARIELTNARISERVEEEVVATATSSRGEEVARAARSVGLGPGQTASIELVPRRATRGLLGVEVRARGHVLTRARICVLPQPHEHKPVDKPFFGVCTHFGQGKHHIPDTLRLMRSVGVEFLRDELYWGAIEREPGRFVFPENYDAYMHAAAGLGIHPLIVTTYANRLYDDGQAPHTEAGRRAYARYVTRLLVRYGNLCQRWEIWNEPNIGFWRGRKPDPAEYFQLLRTTYTAVKQMEPTATVIGVCTAGTDLKFIEGVLKLGGGKYMDDLSIHPYRYPRSPEDSGFVRELQRAVALMRRYGMKRARLWLTEIGWPTHRGRRGVDEQTSANYLVRMYVLARSQPYVAGVAWYDWQDDGPSPTYNEHNFGMVRWRTSQAKAALVAFWVMTRHLSGARLVRQLAPTSQGDQRYAFLFTRGARKVIVAWSAGKPSRAAFRLDCPTARLEWADAHVEHVRLNDGELEVELGGMPVFVTGRFTRAKLRGEG